MSACRSGKILFLSRFSPSIEHDCESTVLPSTVFDRYPSCRCNRKTYDYSASLEGHERSIFTSRPSCRNTYQYRVRVPVTLDAGNRTRPPCLEPCDLR